MKISDFLSVADVMIDLRAINKQQLLLEMSRKAASNLGSSDLGSSGLGLPAEEIYAALGKREQLGSTGMGAGVAIPHARLPGLDRPFAVVARLKPPIDFDAIDGEPVDLVVMLLLPASPQADQLTALALIARTLKSPETLVCLRRAKYASELYEATTK